MCYGTEVLQWIQKAHVVLGTYDCSCGLLTITRSWDHYTSQPPPPLFLPLSAYARALDEQLLQLGMGRTRSLLWQGKCALAMWPSFFHSSLMLLRASQSVCCDSFEMAEECGWSDCKALLNRACYCRQMNGSSLTQQPNR